MNQWTTGKLMNQVRKTNKNRSKDNWRRLKEVNEFICFHVNCRAVIRQGRKLSLLSSYRLSPSCRVLFSSERREAWGELEEAREGAEPYIVAFGRFSQITVGIAKVS